MCFSVVELGAQRSALRSWSRVKKVRLHGLVSEGMEEGDILRLIVVEVRWSREGGNSPSLRGAGKNTATSTVCD